MQTTFIAQLPDGKSATRKSKTMSYTHAVAILTTPHAWMHDGIAYRSYDRAMSAGAVWAPTGEPAFWHVENWCGRYDLALKKRDAMLSRGYTTADKIKIVDVVVQ